ncbi:MAG TPA: zinc ribbon domain-containing protein, partial [Armatimonadota bacterium]|nr:zinc ribbon domain-containing protein [Armatimonadota bacterium]
RMPLYEMKCADCRHTFEILTPTMAVPEGQQCPECGSTAVRRLFSPFYSKTAQKAHTPSPEACRSCPGREAGSGCPYAE